MTTLMLQLLIFHICIVIVQAGYFSRDDDDDNSRVSDDDLVDGLQNRIGIMLGFICGIFIIVGIVIGVTLKWCSHDTQVVFTDVHIIRGEHVEVMNEKYILPV